jgi:uncharacterized protein YndB with AHSA1/START domain
LITKKKKMGQVTTPDFSQFKLRVNIKTAIENAYKAWATPAGLESWFVRKAVFTDEKGVARAGDELIKGNDEYLFLFHSYPDSMEIKGSVLKTNDKDLFSFTFSKKCPVSISIYAEQGQTIVELFESKLPTDDDTFRKTYVSDSKGWIFYLTNLKSILEGGIDLRNKDEAIQRVITA